MEGPVMLKVIIAIMTRLLPIYVCPCGYKAIGRRNAMQHLNSHPEAVGSLDYATDIVNW